MQDIFTDKNTLIIAPTGKPSAELSKTLLSKGVNLFMFTLPYEDENVFKGVVSLFGDIRNKNSLEIALKASEPEIIVYFLQNNPNKNTAELFETNIMGTVNLLELSQSLESLSKIVILFDDNENDAIYKASKDAAIIVARTYENILKDLGINLAFENVEGETSWATL